MFKRKNLRTSPTCTPCRWSLSRCVCHWKDDRQALDWLCFQLATGKMPFSDLSDSNVIVMISKGKRPPIPRRFDAPGTSKAVWKVAKKCWQDKARERPEANEVLQNLENILNLGACTHQICTSEPLELIMDWSRRRTANPFSIKTSVARPI